MSAPSDVAEQATSQDPAVGLRAVAALRRLDIILAIGRGDRMCGNTEYFSAILWQHGIGNALRLWDGWAHDWPYWRKMITTYVGGHD